MMGKVIGALRAPITDDVDLDSTDIAQNILKLPKRFLYKVKFKGGDVRTIKEEFLEKTTRDERFLFEMGLPAEFDEEEVDE